MESPLDVAARAASALGPESSLLANPDVAEFGKAMMSATFGLALRPGRVAMAIAQYGIRMAQIPPAALTAGETTKPPFAVDSRDRRFADATWTNNPAFYALRQCYLAVSELTDHLIGEAALDPVTERKARLATSLIFDLLAPTNFLAANPAALKRAFETGGRSVVRGARNFADDVLNNRGRPRQVDLRPFTVGVNLAATPCKVVYRNELIELLQYEPQTEQVHAKPALFSPPWVNKYYVMDLAPGRSFIEWAVQHRRTAFAISYLNPGPEMAHITMEDYLIQGPKTAIDVITQITGADSVDIVGLCMGGALTAITDAYLSQVGDTRVGDLTLLNTMLDYADPGALATFTDAATVERLEQQMKRTGYLPGTSMAGTFDLLRPNDLIFNYVVSNWLMGQDPPAFDILAWNADNTRIPVTMQAFTLRNLYVENRLPAGTLELAGERIELGNIKNPSYIVSAENDHIVPWKSAYATTQLVSGPSRFVLSSGGHIAGIVNPPGPKGWYLTGDDEPPPSPEVWRAGSTRHNGSWWEDWAVWSDSRAGELVKPPPMGSRKHPVIEDGPGRYVMT